VSTSIQRIAINTGGGDAPGLNAVIKAAVHAADAQGWEILGIREGYDGLLYPDRYHDGGLVPLTPAVVQHIASLGQHDPRYHQPRQSVSWRGAA
jgi:6-phosphofructokinase 1